MQQPADRLRHQERRHQVFEHRAGPRFQAGRHSHRQEGPAQCAPVAARDVAFGDGQETGQPGFRSEQIVIACVERLFLHPQADVEQVTLAVVHAPEIHGHAELAAARGEHQQRRLGDVTVGSLPGQFAAGLRNGEQQPGQVAAVHRGHISGRQDFQASGVVPVQQMAPMLGQALQRVERRLQAAGQLPGADPAELTGTACRQQVQADVGG